MAKLTYETPDEFSRDEEKWLKIFNKRSLIATLLAFIVGMFVYKVLSLFGLNIIGIIFTAILMLLCYGGTHFEIPSELNMNGVGCTIFELLFRKKLRQNKKHRVLYVKGYDRYRTETGQERK